MKRSFQSCLLCLVFSATISLVGCGGDDGNTNTGGDDMFVGAEETQQEGDESTPDPENNEEEHTAPMEDTSTDSVDVPEPTVGFAVETFGKTADGEVVDLYTLTNENGLVVKMITYGAIVVSVETPDREGNLGNINVGFDSMEGYLGGHPYFGSTVGRFCNRIANAKFSLDGEEYTLAANNDPNHLHGGEKGFDKQLWDAEPIAGADFVGIKFSRVSADGEEGYPGNLTTTAIYKLTHNDELVVDLSATTDKKTVVNLTNHNYWNLGGVGSGLVHEHLLKVEADEYLPMDDSGIPTGEIATVTDTTLDFIEFHKIGERLADNMTDPIGYDHCYALRDREKASVDNLVLAATLKHEGTGRIMEIYTSQIGLQFYTGNYLDGSEANAGLAQYSALCLETQHYPDSPNQDQFPTTVLNPGESYRHVTVHRFSAE